ncbi:signal transduction histidine kinase [Streptomyces achromogenes]|uniref:histidine kinase n=1 Tax=Streptomyces achromogenes TaxID=67255 RepID=A0ABU0PZ82_STRAH|nr:ATP-binding protein [Streptomyces achromogenes]MDQ0683654.1 signal transduction histidine kinase [Streptomyces achromogenes]
MSDRVPSSRPVNHRRRRNRRHSANRFLEEVGGVLLAPLLCIVALWGMTILAVWVHRLGVIQLATALGGSVLIAALLGFIRIRAVAASFQLKRDAELQLIAEAAGAAEQTIIWTADELCRGTRPSLPQEWRAGDDPLEKVFELIGNLQVQGAGALLRVHDESQAAVLVEMHRTLTRRQHVLIDEMLEHLTGLQEATEDPVLLDWSFKIDHLATRLRRMVESVSVVLGGRSLRETRRPVQVGTVLRGAKSEVVKYPRVLTVPGDVGAGFALPAHVHPEVAHLLAELIDNGLEHSDPATQVVVRAGKVASGLLIEVEDRATLLMDPGQRDMLNHLLAHPGQADVAAQVRRGHLGLITTAKIAARHGLKVWLTLNAMGGTTANVIIPNRYLVPVAPAVGTVTISTAPVPAAPQPAHAGVVQPLVRPTPGNGGAADRLPRRQRVDRPMPPAAAEPAMPSQAANPRAAADWRASLAAGLSADPGPGTSRNSPS